MKRPRPAAIFALVSASAAPFVAACTCSKVAPEPTPLAQSTSAPSAAALAPSRGGDAEPLPPVAMHSGKLERDPDSGHLRPTTPPPKDDPGQLPPTPTREPDFDLDLDDPSRDYVARYVRATKRYGDKTECVTYGTSYEKAGRRAVDVRDDPKSSCAPTSDTLRDTFLVDVGADRMKLDDPKGRAPLARWPDGSDPEGKPGAVVAVDDLAKLGGGMFDELAKRKLTVIRVQMYGRGTYPLVTLAGWRDPIGAGAKPEDVAPTTAKLCAANGNRPFSIVAGINRSTTLRVRCPSGEARWDKF